MSTPPWPSLYDPSLEIIEIPHHAAVQPGGAYLYRSIDIFRFTLYWSLIFYTPLFLLCGLFAFWNLNWPPSSRPLVTSGQGDPSPSHHKTGRVARKRLGFRMGGSWSSPSPDSYYPLSPLHERHASPPPHKSPPSQIVHAMPSTSTSFPTQPSFPASYPSTMPILPRSSFAGTYPPSPSFKQQGHATSPHPSPVSSHKPQDKRKHNKARSRFTFALIVLFTFLVLSVAGAVLSSLILGFGMAAFYKSADYNMSTWVPFLLAFISTFVGFLSLWSSIIDII